MSIFYLCIKFEFDWCTNDGDLLSDREKKKETRGQRPNESQKAVIIDMM